MIRRLESGTTKRRSVYLFLRDIWITLEQFIFTMNSHGYVQLLMISQLEFGTGKTGVAFLSLQVIHTT